MLITRESDYALRMLRALSDGAMHSVGEISEQELVPRQFAYKIFKKLLTAGLVSVARGAEGGYNLCADLEQVSLYDLMKIIGEDGSVGSCVDPNYVCCWRERHGGCEIYCKLIQIQKKLDQELRSHSLKSILCQPASVVGFHS